MAEQAATPAAPVPEKPKNKGGRPKGYSPKRKTVHEGGVVDDGRNLITRNGQTYEYISADEPDRLRIAPEHIPEGMSYLWVTASILGQPQAAWLSRRGRTGWKPVPASRHDGIFMQKGYEGVIEVDGLILHEKPIEFVERDRFKDKRNAAEQVYLRERAMMSGDAVDNVAFDTTSDKGRKANRIGKTYEKIPVPGNNYQREE